MNDIDLAALADQFLDGELEQAAWDQARVTHGPALDVALARARDIRSALRDFSHPELPAALRQRLLVAAPLTTAPAPLAFPHSTRWWRVALSAAIAALLLVVVLVARQPATTATLTPTVARQETKADTDFDSVQRKNLRGADAKKEQLEKVSVDSIVEAEEKLKETAAKQGFASATDEERRAGIAPGQNASAALAANDSVMEGGLADKDGKPDVARAAPAVAAPAALAAKAAAPVTIAARWCTAEDLRMRDAAPTEQLAQDESVRRDAGGEPPAPAKPLAPMRAAAPAAALHTDEPRRLRITLRNPGSEPLRLTPGSVLLVGIASSGRLLWKTPVQRELTIPAGESTTWDEPVSVIPPGVAQLRVEVQGVRSADILP